MNRIVSPNVTIEPRTADHAEALFAILAEPVLYRYLDEEPPESVEVLRQKFSRGESRTSPDGKEHWLNWVIRDQFNHVAGYVQATVFPNLEANVAYVVGSSYSGRGIAHTAVEKMLGVLATEFGAKLFFIRSEQENSRSVRLAERLGFIPASVTVSVSHGVSPSEILMQKAVP